MFSTMKRKLFAFLSLVSVAATGSNAEILTSDQQTALTTALTGAYSEYMGLLISVVVVSAAFYLIRNFARGLGKGRV